MTGAHSRISLGWKLNLRVNVCHFCESWLEARAPDLGCHYSWTKGPPSAGLEEAAIRHSTLRVQILKPQNIFICLEKMSAVLEIMNHFWQRLHHSACIQNTNIQQWKTSLALSEFKFSPATPKCSARVIYEAAWINQSAIFLSASQVIQSRCANSLYLKSDII